MSENEFDDLTKITGIGPARQRWLRASFNIRTYQDLAALSVDQIESRLKAEGQIISRPAIESWLSKASELGSNISQTQNPQLGSTGEQVSPQTDTPSNEGDWKPFATFVVEFGTLGKKGLEKLQTRVQHIETDTGPPEPWDGIETTELCQWMFNQIRDKPELEPIKKDLRQVQDIGTPLSTVPHSKIKITQFDLFQPPRSKTPIQSFLLGSPYEPKVRDGEPFTFEVTFELSEPVNTDIKKIQVEFNLKYYAYDRAYDRVRETSSILLGEAEPIAYKLGKLTYKGMLPTSTLKKGSYRLWILVTSNAKFIVPDYLEASLVVF